MSTVTLNRGNYLIIGKEETSGYSEYFGYIEDFTREDGGWLKVKHLVHLNEMREVNEIVQYSSRELSTLPKLEPISSSEGVEIHENLKRRIADMQNQRIDQPTRAQEPRLSDFDSDESVESQHVQTPLSITNNSEEVLEFDPKRFTLNLEAGDMKTIISIAEENLNKVFPILDEAVHVNGHVTMDYLSPELQQKFIARKIQEIQEVRTHTFKKDKMYTVYNDSAKANIQYIGGWCWIVEVESGFENIAEAGAKFIRNDGKIFAEEYKIEEITDTDTINKLTRIYNGLVIDEDYLYEIENDAPTIDVPALRNDTLDKITAKELSQQWVNAITYYYLNGGEMSWSELDISTFETSKAIKEVAEYRNDEPTVKAIETA